jgi:hypothetical protein
MEHLKFHLISESGKKMRRNGINDSMEQRRAEGSVVVFRVHKEKTLGENYKEAYELRGLSGKYPAN